MEMELELYHICQPLLEEGAIIKPGNWGRVMMLEQFPKANAGDAENILFEFVLEAVRQSTYPNCPNRLKSSFTCAGFNSAKLFGSRYRPSFPCYKVALVNPELPMFYGSWAHAIREAGTLQTWYTQAHTYWSTNWKTESPNTLELLSESPIRILEEIPPEKLK